MTSRAPSSAPTAPSITKLSKPPPLYDALLLFWCALYKTISVTVLSTCAAACGFLALFSEVGVAQGGAFGSNLFSIAIQAAAITVNYAFPGQITRFVLGDVAIAGAIIAFALAMAL